MRRITDAARREKDPGNHCPLIHNQHRPKLVAILRTLHCLRPKSLQLETHRVVPPPPWSAEDLYLAHTPEDDS
jgi:hypothetical protein